jgi:outer membrane beta-barrel protein
VLGPTQAFAQHEEKVSPLLDAYWIRDLHALRGRVASKAGAVELALSLGVIPNYAAVVYLPVGARLAYHLCESWALELGFDYDIRLRTRYRNALLNSPTIWLGEEQNWRLNFNTHWSPLYGKLALGSTSAHLEFYLTGGAGIVATLADPTLGLGSGIQPDFNFGGGLRFFVGRRFSLRLEFRQHLYLQPTSAGGQGGGVRAPSQVSLLGTVFIGGKR